MDRFTAFSDGVFAIAITLLVLELHVPTGNEPLLPALVEQWPEFLGYLMSVAFIGGIWITHSGMTKLMGHADVVSYGIDLLVMLFVGILPFATNLMVTHLSGPDSEVAVLLYGVNVLLASVALSMLMAYIARERSLVVDGVADATLQAKVRQRWWLIGLAVVGVVIAAIAPAVAVGLYLAMTIVGLILPMLAMRHHRPAHAA